MASKTRISATKLGDFVRYSGCQRRLKLDLTDRKEVAESVPFWNRLYAPLDPVLSAMGRRREEEWQAALDRRDFTPLNAVLDDLHQEGQLTWREFCQSVQILPEGRPGYAREVSLVGEFDAFEVDGRIDFLLVIWRDGRPVLRLVECKASRKDRTYQRIQVAIYRTAVKQKLAAEPLVIAGHTVGPDDVECLVARIDEETNQSYDMLAADPISDEEMQVLTDDLNALLTTGGIVQRICGAPLDELEFQLDAKCADCIFNVYCYPESARERRIELLGVEPAQVRLLNEAGVNTVDDLSVLDPESAEAAALRRGGVEGIDTLVARAQTRRATLPDLTNTKKKPKEVQYLPGRRESTLPVHVRVDENGVVDEDSRIVRVFLIVDHDYTENRLVSITAHVTRSDGEIHTGFKKTGKGWQPDPELKERRRVGEDADGKPEFQTRPLTATDSSRDIVEIVREPWTGDALEDSRRERDMLERFFGELVATIGAVAKAPAAPVHFYVWQEGELRKLLEACARVDSRLLKPMRDLLGCRDGLEQLIYSSLQAEIDRRFALAWSGRSLAAVASLGWFGGRYHWKRKLGGQELDLEKLFAQDIFDYTDWLAVAQDGSWSTSGRDRAGVARFEIRGRYSDSLTAPYFHAFWGSLRRDAETGERDEEVKAKTRKAIQSYWNAAKPPRYLETYLRSRAHALRWLEERIGGKNEGIRKPHLSLAELNRFSLDEGGVGKAAVDFLRLDQHVKRTEWLSALLVNPEARVLKGVSLPVRDVVGDGAGTLTAQLDSERFDVPREQLTSVASIGAGSFVRLTPAPDDPRRGQTIAQILRGGKTCRVVSVDWDSGEVLLEPMFMRETTYIVGSVAGKEEGLVFDYATIDESPSDFVAGRVEKRLEAHLDHPVCSWFDLTNPRIPEQTPLDPDKLAQIEKIVTSPIGGAALAPDQADAVLQGIASRCQLLQGPPGTGKSQTTSLAALARILARRKPGDIVVVAANTHTAVDTLLERIDRLQDDFADVAAANGLPLAKLKLVKVANPSSPGPGGRIGTLEPKSGVLKKINELREDDSIVILGGTTGSMLKLANELDERKEFSDRGGFRIGLLFIDEASMLVFPHFLAIATMLDENGEIMLAGDHRQLSPIVAHDWDNEDRPPAILYQPFVSSYEAVRALAANGTLPETAVRRSALEFTFRLPAAIRKLIRVVYRTDGIDLKGREDEDALDLALPADPWQAIWHSPAGVFLVVHEEDKSKSANPFEAQLAAKVLEGAGSLPDGAVAMVTPHRAQRALLGDSLKDWYPGPIDLIDTVERMQGGERPTVIVSAVASDPAAIAARAEFLMNLNRANVAFSRAKERLVVICSRALIEHIPADLELYDSAMLWKTLRRTCADELGDVVVDGHRVRILAAGEPRA